MKFTDSRHSHVWKEIQSLRYCFLIDIDGLFGINFPNGCRSKNCVGIIVSLCVIDLGHFRVTYYVIISIG